MVSPTGPTDPNMKKLAIELKKDKRYVKLAEMLLASKRRMAEVDISRIVAEARGSEAIAVPGVVLADGEINKPVTVYARRFSRGASKKIESAGGKALLLKDLINDGVDVKILK